MTMTIGTIVSLVILPVLGGAAPAAPRQPQRAALADARALAYNANFRNDADGLNDALKILERLAADDESGALTSYYAAWTAWSLAGSHFQAKNMDAAKASVEIAVRHARRGAAR